MGRRPLLILSLALATASLSTRWVVPRPPAFVPVSLVLTLAWFIVLLTSLRKHGRWGNWVLLGAPLALYWHVRVADLRLLFRQCRLPLSARGSNQVSAAKRRDECRRCTRGRARHRHQGAGALRRHECVRYKRTPCYFFSPIKPVRTRKLVSRFPDMKSGWDRIFRCRGIEV